MQPLTKQRLAAGVLVLMVALTACVSSEGAAEWPPWGSEPARYFDELSMAYTDGDTYGVLDFYAASAEVEKWRGAVEGGARRARSAPYDSKWHLNSSGWA